MENPKQTSGLNRLEAPVEALACADAENCEGPLVLDVLASGNSGVRTP